MKNPLTSKERRGLTAVAAAALLCIASGFIFRNCSSCNRHGNNEQLLIVSENDSIPDDNSLSRLDSTHSSKHDAKRKSNRINSKSSDKKNKGKSSQKRKAEKVYPTRDPLSQPCD